MNFRPCVIIPVYNHADVLAKKVAFFAERDLPCYLVNDGSTDHTAAVLAQLAAAYANVTVITRAQNGGKGAAVKSGFRAALAAGFSHALQIDADDQHNLADVDGMLARAQQDPQALIAGYPLYDDSLPAARKYGRYITHFWVWVETLSLSAVRDSMCGFRVYPLAETCRVIDREPVGDRMDFDIALIVRLYWSGMPVINVPTRVTYPVDGVSHFRVLQDNLRITAMHTRLVLSLLLWQLPRRCWQAWRKPSASAHHWAQLSERGSYLGMWFCLQMYRRLGRRVCSVLVQCVTAYFFLFSASARKASRGYLRQLSDWSGQRTPAPTFRNSLCHFLQFSTAILDRFACWIDGGRHLRLHSEGLALVEAQLQRGQGAVLLCSHLGNAELASIIAEQYPQLKLNILLHTAHAQNINRLQDSLGIQRRANFLQVSEVGVDTAIHLHDAIARGEWVVIAADRTPVSGRERTLSIPFLGKPAPFAQGPFLLASLLACPVYTLFCLRESDGSYSLQIAPFAESLHAPRRERAAVLQQAQQRYVSLLEQQVSRYPLQWFNFYDFWFDDRLGDPASDAIASGSKHT